jgi:hypothetical protein
VGGSACTGALRVLMDRTVDGVMLGPFAEAVCVRLFAHSVASGPSAGVYAPGRGGDSDQRRSDEDGLTQDALADASIDDGLKQDVADALADVSNETGGDGSAVDGTASPPSTPT